jgi:hypothetical protein
MVYLHTKNTNLGTYVYFGESWNGKCWCLYVFYGLGIFYKVCDMFMFTILGYVRNYSVKTVLKLFPKCCFLAKKKKLMFNKTFFLDILKNNSASFAVHKLMRHSFAMFSMNLSDNHLPRFRWIRPTIICSVFGEFVQQLFAPFSVTLSDYHLPRFRLICSTIICSVFLWLCPTIVCSVSGEFVRQ